MSRSFAMEGQGIGFQCHAATFKLQRTSYKITHIIFFKK